MEKGDENLLIPETGLAEVRDILYGEQQRNLEQRLDHMARSFHEGLEKLTHRMEMELTNLESPADTGGRQRGVALHLEHRINETEATITRQTGAVQQQVSEINEQVGRATARLAEQIDLLTQKLADTERYFKEVTGDLHEQLKQGLAQMEHRKVDNEQLAAMLAEMSKHLSKDK